MASCKTLSVLAMVLVLLPMIAMADSLDPLYEKICDKVECGKGTCVGNISYPMGYYCQCEAGWKRSQYDDANDDLPFLPCVIPNCTLNYGNCQPAPPPAPAKPNPYNLSAFDPCYWMYCGEGTCSDDVYKHTCTCKSGYFNLLNISYFPCYSECTIGSDCTRLGITVSNQQTSPSSPSGSSPASQATSILPGKFQLMAILLLSAVVVLRK